MYIETHYHSCGRSVYGDMEIRFHRGVALYKGLSYILYVAKGIGTEVHWMTSTVSNTDMKLHGFTAVESPHQLRKKIACMSFYSTCDSCVSA